jgi:hypothetical protein
MMVTIIVLLTADTLHALVSFCFWLEGAFVWFFLSWKQMTHKAYNQVSTAEHACCKPATSTRTINQE